MFSILIENPVIRFQDESFAGDVLLLRMRNARRQEKANPAATRDYFTSSGESGLFSLVDPEEAQARAYAQAGRAVTRAGGESAKTRDFARSSAKGPDQAGSVPEKNLQETAPKIKYGAVLPQDAPQEAKKTGASAAEAGKSQDVAEQNSGKSEGEGQGETEKTDGVLGLDEAEKRELEELKARDREVRAHEQAHAAAGGSFAGRPTYQMQTGPDGRRYAVGGEVAIDVSAEATPEATIAKARKIRSAALAPAEPSSADRAIAAKAARLESEAAREKMSQQDEERVSASGEPDENAPAGAAGSASGMTPETAEPGATVQEKLKAKSRFETADTGRIRKAAQAYVRVSGALAPIAPEFARPLSLAV
ncbi:MAG: hypothetical protein LBB52_03840 [Desulfovibrio sp.]|jgi:hypothetical protein|nr:hypothetical protein [Desulfovibrio sp.]